MNKLYISLMLAVAMIYYPTLQSAIGCMEKSLHLQEKYDPKVWHFVRCNCPCAKYQAQCSRPMPHDQCPKCRHLHVPQSQIIVTKAVRMTAMQKAEQTSPVAFENGDKTLRALINKK